MMMVQTLYVFHVWLNVRLVSMELNAKLVKLLSTVVSLLLTDALVSISIMMLPELAHNALTTAQLVQRPRLVTPVIVQQIESKIQVRINVYVMMDTMIMELKSVNCVIIRA